MGTVGIIAFAFGQQGEKKFPVAGPSNRKISKLADDLARYEESRGDRALIAAQWETACSLPEGMVALQLSEFNTDTHYIDTETGFNRSITFFKENDAERVILVAHHLHLSVIKLMIKSGRWKTQGMAIDHHYDELMKEVPYDRSPGNVQWWTRNRIGFSAYLAKALVSAKHGS